MKRLTVLFLCLALLLSGCGGDATSTTQADSSETTTVTSEPPTTSKVASTAPPETTAAPQIDEQALPIAIFNDKNADLGMRLVSTGNLDTVVGELPYSAIGSYDPASGRAIAVTFRDNVAIFSVVDQFAKNIEPSNQYLEIIKLRSGLFYGYTESGVQYVFDAGGVIYGTIADYNEPQYDVLTNAIYVNNAVYLVDDKAQKLVRVDDLESYYEDKKALLDAQYNITYNEDKQIYSHYTGDEADSFNNYLLVDDYAIVETNEGSADQPLIRYGLLERGGDKILATEYYDIGHLAGEYFYVATNGVAELEQGALGFRYNDYRSYKKAIYHLNEQLTEQLYFNIEYVKDDVFHVFDGVEHFFISAESGVRLWPDVQLDGHYYFYQVADYIVALDDLSFPRSLVVIKDDKVVLRSAQRQTVAGGYVEVAYSGFATTDQQLPHVVLEDKTVAQKINDYYRANYAVAHPQSAEAYYDSAVYDTFAVLKHKKLIQIQMQNYVNSFAAAHPSYGYYSAVFSAQTGQPYKLTDWFKKDADYRQVLADIMLQNEENMARALFYDSAMANEEMLNMFAFDEVNYYFTDDSLVLYYNPYSFASYADGIIEFKIGLSDISDILNDEAKELLLE